MRHSRAWPILLLAALALLAYWPVSGAGFIWDDDDYVTQNPVLRSVGGIASIWFEPTSLPQYYPLVHTSFWLEYRLWGADPLGYHVVNVLLHLGGGIALFHLLRRLALPGALFAAALFVAHPVAVESVAWITERKNTLSLVCALVAALTWLRWQEGGSRRTWWVATIWFVAALLSKTVTASLPAALLVMQWWRHGRIERREIRALLPWFALGLSFGLFTAYLEATHVGATGQTWQLVGGERFVVAGRAVWFYLGQLLWPIGLCFNYERWQIDTGSWLQWLPLAAALAALAATFVLRQRIGRGATATLLLFGGMLVPALGFFDVYPFRFSYVADHFQYHAMVAVLAATAALLTGLSTRLPRPTAIAIAGLLATALAALSNYHSRNYRDLETSWRATLACNPDSMLALTNLGGLLLERDDVSSVDEAEIYLQRSLAADPGSYESIANLGQVAHRRGDFRAARQRYDESLAMRRDQPAVLNNLATLMLQQSETAAAYDLVREAIELNPDLYQARVTMAWTCHALGRWREAIEHADWVLMRTPEARETRLVAAKALLEVGEDAAALQNAAAALRQGEFQDARSVFVRAFARFLQTQPIAGLSDRVDTICRSGGFDAATLRPAIAAELRSLGAAAHADALTGNGGR